MKRIAILLLAATLHAQQPDHFPITPHQVAQALVLHGLGVSEDQIAIPASIVASSSDPLLNLEAMQPLSVLADDPRTRARIKLVCREQHTCLPFYAIVTWPGGTVLPATPMLTRTAPRASEPISMRAGSKATLLVDTTQMHISLPVICLQSGPVGAQIHVTSPDHHQTWIATIVSPTLLTGSL